MEKTQIGKMIGKLRREKGYTQNEVAEKLSVSYQAISQWENENTYPDIELIPSIAKLFGVTIDELFGISKEQDSEEVEDNKIYIVAFLGNKRLARKQVDELVKKCEIEIELKGDVHDIESWFSVNVQGNVNDINSGHSVNCQKVLGSVRAGHSVTCMDVTGAVTAGHSVDCGNVGGNIAAGHKVVYKK